jgi:hypothetical protein
MPELGTSGSVGGPGWATAQVYPSRWLRNAVATPPREIGSAEHVKGNSPIARNLRQSHRACSASGRTAMTYVRCTWSTYRRPWRQARS